MVILRTEDYKKTSHLITSKNELSVFSVLNGNMPGKVFANSTDNPTSVFVKTSEANLIAGSTHDEEFNNAISGEIDLWDQVTPDSHEWGDKIPMVHENEYIKEYTRRRYLLSGSQFIKCERPLPKGFVIENVDLSELKKKDYINSDKIFKWANGWGDEENFAMSGCGYYIRKDNKIVSWSMTDCAYNDSIAIGIHTDSEFRKQGFGIAVASQVAHSCFDKGYKTIEWLCVGTNRGSQAIAEKLGFRLENEYCSFSSYPPIENPTDLSEEKWYEWGEYLETASQSELRLYQECLLCFIKANSVEKAISILNQMKEKDIDCEIPLKDCISYYQKIGMSLNFSSQTWSNYVKSFT